VKLGSLMDAVEIRTIAKVSRRLVPFLIACYFVAYLDRVNVGFAALAMNHDLGLSQTAFGLGAGIFFIAYFIFEVPSNLLLERFGARQWIARIMLSWGILSGTMAFIPAIAHAAGLGNENSFYLLRVLLGAAAAARICRGHQSTCTMAMHAAARMADGGPGQYQ
jgi:MFS transporter, ACS family, tartrate transporter